MGKRVCKIGFIGLCGLGILWFCLPILHGGFGEGSVFGIAICAAGIALAVLYPKAVGQGGARRVLARTAVGLYLLGLGWTGYLTALIIISQAGAVPQGLNVVVLGAQVYSAERMGKSLSGRVDKAAEYLLENPQVRCIVTGGQGSNEPCPEALTAKNALIRRGVDPERIYMEDKSRNTRQNLAYAMDIARERGLDTKVAVVSQNFHMYRALRLARSAGFEAYALPADTDWIIFPSYYGRELMSLTKWYLEELAGRVFG